MYYTLSSTMVWYVLSKHSYVINVLINVLNTMSYHCQPCAGLLTISQILHMSQCLDKPFAIPMVQKVYVHIYVLHPHTRTIHYTLNDVLCRFIPASMSACHPLAVREGNSRFATISLFYTKDRWLALWIRSKHCQICVWKAFRFC